MSILPSGEELAEPSRLVLADLLRTPVFIEAVNIIIRSAQPRPNTFQNRPAAEVSHQLAGMNEFVHQLKVLSVQQRDLKHLLRMLLIYLVGRQPQRRLLWLDK